MKKQQNTADVVLVAAAVGAAAAGAVIAVYEALKSERGQAGIAKVKTGAMATAAKVKTGAIATADKVKVGAVATAEKVKAGVAKTADKVISKLPRKSVADECDCDLGLEDEGVCDVEETAEEAAEA
ncbi:MAG: hypothetical protein IIX90_06255 [Clostridia bacterium]|nr:hypothetical protein [Clostridia bacterium]